MKNFDLFFCRTKSKKVKTLMFYLEKKREKHLDGEIVLADTSLSLILHANLALMWTSYSFHIKF